MLGVPINEPAKMLRNNKSRIMSTMVPSSALKKKHDAIAYHCVHEAIAAGIITFAQIKSKSNYADILTKPFGNEQFMKLVATLLFRMPRFNHPDTALLISPKDEGLVIMDDRSNSDVHGWISRYT
jgi:hypothetical protein